MGYLISKPSLQKISSGIEPIAGGIRKFKTFPKVIGPKKNALVWLEFELITFDGRVQYLSHYVTGTLPMY